MSDAPIIVQSTDKSLGKLESDINYLRDEVHEIKGDMKEHGLELKKLNQFLDQARGAKTALVGMWFLAGVVWSALTSAALYFSGFLRGHAN
jgi:hypothetical protein